MSRSTRTSVILLIPLLLAGCAVETEDMGPDAAVDMAVDLAAEEQAIRDRVDAWERAANESAESFASFYASDGVLMAPNAPPAEGPQAIAQAMGPMFQAVQSVTFDPTDIEVARSGDLAVERGRYSLTGTTPDGSSFQDEGSYLVAWRKMDGQWMVTNDIFNTDRPMPEGGM